MQPDWYGRKPTRAPVFTPLFIKWLATPRIDDRGSTVHMLQAPKGEFDRPTWPRWFIMTICLVSAICMWFYYGWI